MQHRASDTANLKGDLLTNEPLTGALPALVTAFDETGRAIDEEAMRQHIEYCVTAGVSGLVICGGTGEFTSLSNGERRRVAELTVDQVAGRAAVFVQSGAMTTLEAVGLSEHAQSAGADGLMLGVPYYEPLPNEAILAYYEAVTEASDLPVMIYHYPHASGVDFSGDLLRQLLERFPTVKYMKDSGGSLRLTSDVIAEFGDRLTIFSGIDSLAGPALSLGARGVVNAAANVFPAEFVHMCAAAAAGDLAAVSADWLRLMPFLQVMEANPFVSAVKHACEVLGYPVGPVRAPLPEIPPASRERLERAIADLM